MQSNGRDFSLIALTVLTGMMLVALPLPRSVGWFRPAWVFMVMLFWFMAAPHRVSIASAFVVGLLLDLLTGTLFGQHALALTFIAYFMVRFQAPIRSFPAWQQTLLVLIVTVVYLALQYWVMALAGLPSSTWKYWLPIVTTTLFWPWVSLLLRDFQYRFRLG